MKAIITAILVLGFAGSAAGTTAIDLMCLAEVVTVGNFDEENNVLNLVVEFLGVVPEESFTGEYAEWFMEVEGSCAQEIALEGVTADIAAALSPGEAFNVNYSSFACVYSFDDGVRGYSGIIWTFRGMDHEEDILM